MGVRVGGRAVATSGLLLALALTACGSPAGYTPAAPLQVGSAPAGSAPARPDPGERSPANVTPASVALPGTEAAPVGLVDTAEDGSLNIPKDIDTLGWWVGSKPMGATRGATLIAGHVDSAVAGLGYFSKLTDLEVGDPITVVDGLGVEWKFEVSDTSQQSKSALPQDVFDTEGDRKLVLITCGGEFDEVKRSYADNYIVYATPV